MKSRKGKSQTMSLYMCSSPCLKRCLLLLLTLTLVYLIVTFTRETFSISGQSTIFELRTDDTGSQDNIHKRLDGIQGALDSLTSFMKSIGRGTAQDLKDTNQFGVNNTEFRQVLQQRANKDKVIILASVDSGYVDMAINLYFTSFKKFKLENYLFVGSDAQVCGALLVYNIACFDYIHDRDATSSSGFFSKAFKRKTHLKTKIILEALKTDLKVLITDVDIVFLKNPLPHLTCTNCDIEISSDVVEGNSGFYLAKPTPPSIRLHNDAWNQGLAKPDISNQKAIDRLMEKMIRAKQIKVKNLNAKTFANGKVFFEDGKRMFTGDNPCKDCVILHNNWIVSGAAKVYRFKEYGLWDNDRMQYYSAEKNKYIAFDLPIDFGKADTGKKELDALKVAFILGHLLKRIVILPRFHCYGCKYNGICKQKNARCTFATFYRIDQLEKSFKDDYRENVFLSHPRVPSSIKNSVSPIYYIHSTNNNNHFKNLSTNVKTFTPKDFGQGPTVAELQKWFRNSTESVLQFHNLYTGVGITKNDTDIMANFMTNLKTAFKSSDFRQY